MLKRSLVLTLLACLFFSHFVQGSSEKNNDTSVHQLNKGIAVVDTFRGVVLQGGKDGSVTAIVEGLDFKLDDRLWQKKIHTRGNPEIIQFFLPNENPQNWSEVVTVHKLRGQVEQFTPKVIAEKMRSVSSAKANIISETDHDLLYDGYTDAGKRYELVRVIMGQGVIYTLFYASKNMDMINSQKEKWAGLLQNAKIIS